MQICHTPQVNDMIIENRVDESDASRRSEVDSTLVNHPERTRVAVIGCGLIGGSVAAALAKFGCTVFVSDIDAAHEAKVREQTRAQSWRGETVEIVVVATPPNMVVDTALEAHRQVPDAVITDVASVKSDIVNAMASSAAGPVFVGGHPIAGGASPGPADSSADMFHDKTWIITPSSGSATQAVALVAALAQWCGARPTTMSAEDHDQVLALTSHAVQVVSSAVAGELLNFGSQSANLSGPALRDVTRVAASDPDLWTEILTGNASAVAPHLHALAARLGEVARALESGDAAAITEFMRRGSEGRSLLD